MATKSGNQQSNNTVGSFAKAEVRSAVANDLLDRMGIEHSKRVGYELGTLTDAVNEQLVRAEGALRDLGYGCSAGVLVEPGTELVWSEWLVFDKWNREWKLLLVSRPDKCAIDEFGNFDDEGEWVVPLLEASRQRRLAAATKLPELLQVLTRRAEGELAAVTAAVEGIEAFNEAMGLVR